MADRSAPIVVTPHACPFVALEGDRDRRLDAPDALHRCFAEPIPRARSMTHQADFCLSSMFAACPIFLDWASRAAAEPVLPRIPAAASPLGSVLDESRPVTAATQVPAPAQPATTPAPDAARADTRAPTAAVPLAAAVPASVPATGASAINRGVPLTPPWDAPPPWLRPVTTEPWLAEAVPPPDAFADFATGAQHPVAVAEGTRPVVPVPVERPDAAGGYAEETTGMPPATAAHSGPTSQGGVAVAPPLDAEAAAELAASRYRTDALAGADLDDLDDAPRASNGAGAPGVTAPGATQPRQRRVPIDANASSTLAPQARPSAHSTGSREWEGPRRFEAYAATQRRRPAVLIAAGGAVVLTAVILAALLVPGGLLSGAAAPTASPVPTLLAAAAPPGGPVVRPTSTPKPKPERTPRSYQVRSGDTLIKIGRRFNVSIETLQCVNHIRNPNNVVVGSTLTIPTRAYRCPKETKKP